MNIKDLWNKSISKNDVLSPVLDVQRGFVLGAGYKSWELSGYGNNLFSDE